MQRCSKECVPSCSFCAHSRHEGTNGPIGCAEHTDWEHQQIAISNGHCDDFVCYEVLEREKRGNKVKLKNITEIEAFREAVNKCAGDVWLESSDGDKFNLKSGFSQYIALGALLGENGDNLELFCGFKEDQANFFEFFAQHPAVL